MNALSKPEALALSEQSARELNAIIERDALAAAESRSRAAARILAGTNRQRRAVAGPTGQELLQQVRYRRHGL